MAEWTRSEPIYDLIPNLYVQKVFKDGEFQYYVLYPCEGYLLHIPSGDSLKYDDEDNLILDKRGNPVIEPYLTLGGATASSMYDFSLNSEGYKGVLNSNI